MAIELLQTMQWSKLCWNESWEEIIELQTLLPKVSKQYPIKLRENEKFAKEGQAFILWQPPQSELNGWADKRPSEILKSYILKGILTNRNSDYETHDITFDFEASTCLKLVSCFKEVCETKKSPLSFIKKIDGSSMIQWQNAHKLWKSKVGNYLYISGADRYTYLELILSREEDKLCVHYSSILPLDDEYKTIVTKYYLNSDEQKIIERLLLRATEIVDNLVRSLPEHQIYGARYW